MAASTYLHEYAARAAAALGPDLEACITVRAHGLTLLAASSADGAERCDRAELRAGDGPCIQAAAKESTLVVASVAQDARWEAWREQTVREGFASSIAVPALAAPGVTVTLNVYARGAGEWPSALVETAEAFAGLVAAGVRVHLGFADLEDAAAGLYRTMTDAVAVERALGAIMASNGCSRDEAHRVLRSASLRRDVSERVVAESILRSLALGGRGDIVDERSP
ncbi:GAF and ANTAR domain-containing protein [Puerhibacterium puerhi]|uniref:GAF and ANTAR domain-containing protein n=1 Tax=Puerhibacterium puerhi TaxID=2692623 RepID=UPI0013584A55|nr:GAF and ANTAR domain-containing protein [Puerhibacterium puerhi]